MPLRQMRDYAIVTDKKAEHRALQKREERDMDKCPICGRENPLPEANFCYYCGAQFKALTEPVSNPKKEAYQTDEEKEIINGKPFGTVRWILCFLLLLIPIYGWTAFIVIMAVSAFSPNATKERKAISRALLIFGIALFAILIVSFVIMMKDPTYQEYLKEMMETYSSGSEVMFGGFGR